MIDVAPHPTPRRPGTPDMTKSNDIQSPPPTIQLNDSPSSPQNDPPDPLPPRSRSRSMVRALQAISPTLTLENSGSVARDHLASERTWLAYVRTSLAIAGTGVALVQLFTVSVLDNDDPSSPFGNDIHLEETIQRFARPLGATTVLLGLGVLCIGVQRYFKIQRAMTEGHFPAARKTVVVITAVLAVLVAIVFGVLVAIPRREG